MAKTKTIAPVSKKLDIYPNAAAAISGAKKRGEPSVTFKLNEKPTVSKAVRAKK